MLGKTYKRQEADRKLLVMFKKFYSGYRRGARRDIGSKMPVWQAPESKLAVTLKMPVWLAPESMLAVTLKRPVWLAPESKFANLRGLCG